MDPLDLFINPGRILVLFFLYLKTELFYNPRWYFISIQHNSSIIPCHAKKKKDKIKKNNFKKETWENHLEQRCQTFLKGLWTCGPHSLCHTQLCHYSTEAAIPK